MDANGAMTVVAQLITDARSRFGAANVETIEVQGPLLDEAMDHVLALGGEVSTDVCVVDGVKIRELPDDAETPRVHLRDSDDPEPLLSSDQS